MKLKELLTRIIKYIKKSYRQRNYKLIYSDRYGYGVENKIADKLKQQWFLNHDDFIEED